MLASQWKYVPVRRLALIIEESLFRGTQWAVFEPNDEPLWAQLRLNLRRFMQGLFRQGAFQGTKPREAYLVKCDAETTTQDDIDRGIVNILVGFAPLKPAEFVVIRIQQLAGTDAGVRRRATDGTVQRQRDQRFDPYKNFKFRVKWDGRYVAGISKVGALKRTTEVVKHREGGDPSSSRKSPGRTEYEAITLERGVTHDTEFEQWANKVWNFGSGPRQRGVAADFRKDMIIEVYNEAGQLAIAYRVFRCWVSEFQALPDLDANANAVAIQTHQARERGLGARLRRRGADRADLHRAVSRTRGGGCAGRGMGGRHRGPGGAPRPGASRCDHPGRPCLALWPGGAMRCGAAEAAPRAARRRAAADGHVPRVRRGSHTDARGRPSARGRSGRRRRTSGGGRRPAGNGPRGDPRRPRSGSDS